MRDESQPTSPEPPQPKRWSCLTDRGWKEYPQDIDRQLREAAANGSGLVRCKLRSETYDIDVSVRTQRNINTGMVRLIRPPGEEDGQREKPCFSADNCAASVSVAPDRMSASWGDAWGAVAVCAPEGRRLSGVQLRCLSMQAGKDIAVGLADAGVADMRSKERPHGETGGWLLRGCLEETASGGLTRGQFNLWTDGACQVQVKKELLGPGEPQGASSEVEVRWEGDDLVWLEDLGSGIAEQARLRCGPAEVLYCWAYPGASVQLLGATLGPALPG